MDNPALINSVLINIALVTILLPFAGAILTACLPQQWAKWSCTFFSLLATLGTILLAYVYLSGGKVDVTFDLIHYGDMALFGLTIDRISTLIAFAVVFLGLLVSIYSTGYLTLGNREHPHEGTNRYYALLLVFIGAMAGLVLSSTLLGQLFFFEITGGCSWGLIGYYQSQKSLRSALKALLVTHVAAIGLYLAAAVLLVNTGTFALTALAQLDHTTKVIVFGGILFAARGNRPSYHCISGYRMRWRPRPQSVPICTPRRWSKSASISSLAPSTPPVMCRRLSALSVW